MPWYPKLQESLQRQPACRLPHRNGAEKYGDLAPRGQAFGFGVSGMRERVEVCAHLLVSIDSSAMTSLFSSHSTDTSGSHLFCSCFGSVHICSCFSLSLSFLKSNPTNLSSVLSLGACMLLHLTVAPN
jgi:hypothetical protein